MSTANVVHPIDVTLNVAYVEHGGNTGNGRYFYSFNPDIVTVVAGQGPTPIVYRLDEEVSTRFRIRHVVKSDPLDQIVMNTPTNDSQSITLVDLNTHSSLIFLSFLVYDTQHQVLVNCDPQIGNVPDVDP